MLDVCCCRDGDIIRKFRPGGNVTRVVNQLSIEGFSGDAVQRALDGRLNLRPITCIGIAPDQSSMFFTDWAN